MSLNVLRSSVSVALGYDILKACECGTRTAMFGEVGEVGECGECGVSNLELGDCGSRAAKTCL